jgi:hypothetical protein
VERGPEDHLVGQHRRVHYVPPPHELEQPDSEEKPAGSLDPPGVMWPDAGSGFEPSYYSPAGELLQDAQIASNLGRDPGGIWRAIRGSWGLWIIIGGVLLVVVVALISAAV